jgi:hypothetical protein
MLSPDQTLQLESLLDDYDTEDSAVSTVELLQMANLLILERKSRGPAPLDLCHLLGNPLFALETNLEPLLRRINEGKTKEAACIVGEIRLLVERIKAVLADTKNVMDSVLPPDRVVLCPRCSSPMNFVSEDMTGQGGPSENLLFCSHKECGKVLRTENRNVAPTRNEGQG